MLQVFKDVGDSFSWDKNVKNQYQIDTTRLMNTVWECPVYIIYICRRNGTVFLRSTTSEKRNFELLIK